MLTAPLTAPEVLALVRVHADRLHDAVRRLGCAPAAAVEVVETATLDLVEAVRNRPETVGDPVGWLFARARSLGRSLADSSVPDDLPLGGGVLGTDANQVRLAEALEDLPERQRAAVLLRDSYDLPASAVGTSLGLDADQAMAVVAEARLAFLPRLLGSAAVDTSNHAPDLAALARLGEGRTTAARDATVRRHTQSCETCAAVLDTQERAHRLLSGLTVVAMPDAEREALLARVDRRSAELLPAAVAVEELEEDDEPRRLVPLSLIALGLLLAVGAGGAAGAYASRDHTSLRAASGGAVPLVTAAPVLTVPPAPPPTVSPTPTPRVFLITPSPTPSPTASPTALPGPTETLTLTLSPTSGPNGTTLTVSGTGWTPGAVVVLAYLDPVGHDTGSGGSATVDARGRFTTTLVAQDPANVPGRHTVNADDGTRRQAATFTQTG